LAAVGGKQRAASGGVGVLDAQLGRWRGLRLGRPPGEAQPGQQEQDGGRDGALPPGQVSRGPGGEVYLVAVSVSYRVRTACRVVGRGWVPASAASARHRPMTASSSPHLASDNDAAEVRIRPDLLTVDLLGTLSAVISRLLAGASPGGSGAGSSMRMHG
jgi:hypothetical protein